MLSYKIITNVPIYLIPESVFIKFIEWYGLTPNSQLTATNLILDRETNSLVTEYNKCVFRVQYLLPPD